MPDFLVADVRGQTDGVGPARIGVLRDGWSFEQIGGNIADGGADLARSERNDPRSLVRRFMGQIWASTSQSTANTGAIRPYDEGGIDDWAATATDVTAKGGVGRVAAMRANTFAELFEVLTEDRAYLLAVGSNVSLQTQVDRYNPDTNTWTTFTSAGGVEALSSHSFVHDGLLFCVTNGTSSQVKSFDPVTGLFVTYALPTYGVGQSGHRFFTIHNRLFVATRAFQSNVSGENAWLGEIAEFSFGVWTNTGLDTNLGGNNPNGTHDVIRISDTRVMLMGLGSGRTVAGVIAVSLGTVGDSPTGALELKDTTQNTSIAVVPLNLRPTTAGYGTGGGTNEGARIYATTVTDDPTGTIRHFVYFIPNGLAVSVPILYEVFDDVTPMTVVPQTVQADSDFAFPHAFYGGGAMHGGLDGSTRYVSCQARGWQNGNTGLRVKVSAHGDGLVLAYHNKSGAFTIGETIQGQSSGAEAVLVGDGTSQGLHLRSSNGTPFTGDEQIMGLTSTQTADLNLVLLHSGETGSPFELSETVTDGTTGATGIIRQLGLGGGGEQLIKVEWTNSPTAFGNGNIITGSANSTTATLSSAPLGQHGGVANKKIRVRFATGGGKEVPSGFATMVAGTGIGATVSKGSGPSGSDELINVVADGAPGDTPISFEWDYITDGVPQLLVTQLVFEIERPAL